MILARSDSQEIMKEYGVPKFWDSLAKIYKNFKTRAEILKIT